MSGNGEQPRQEQAQSTSSIFGDMFGIGQLFKVITDPALQAHTHAMLAAVIEGASATRRVEAKLDRLLIAMGQRIEDINEKWPADMRAGVAPPALLEGDRANGNRGFAPSSEPSDNGGRGAAPVDRAHGGNVFDPLASHPAGEV